jgi:hypothetical protein
MIGEASASKTTTPLCSPSTRNTATNSRRKLSKKGSSEEGGGGLDLLEGGFCETFAGAAGCATANGEQVVPLELGNDDIDAYLQFYFTDDKTEMVYAISIDGVEEDLDLLEGSLEISLYCGFAGAVDSTLLAELEFQIGEDGEPNRSVLTKDDLLPDEDDEDAPAECQGRPVEEILDIFDLMVDGTIFFEVMVNSAASEDDPSEASYVRGQIFL